MKKALAIAILTGLCAQAQTDPVIEAARKAAADYANSLPDYIVKRTTSRYRKLANGAGVATLSGAKNTPQVDMSAGTRGWQIVDVITGDVTVQRGGEIFANLRVNGEPAKELPPGGSWSEGEFAGQIPMVFSPGTAAVFSHPHAESMRGHATVRYDFAVDRDHSKWSMAGYGNDFSPPYSGKVWIEQQTGEPLAIEMSADKFPWRFPATSVDTHTDYDYEKIGDEEFLLPIHSQTTSCGPGGNICLRNDTEFKDFRKFESSSSLTFDEPPKQ